MQWGPFKFIVSSAALELGLVSATIADPFASTDKNIIQLTEMLNMVGMNLARQYNWTQLERTHYFVTVAGKNHYRLPLDFLRMARGSIWNRTAAEKSSEGPTPQQWRGLKDASVSGGFADVVRISGNRFYIHPEPSAVETLAFQYQSAYWLGTGVSDWALSTAYNVGDYAVNDTDKVFVCTVAGTSAGSGGPTGTGDSITDGTCTWDFVSDAGEAEPPNAQTSDTATDAVWFDMRLATAALKLAFLKAKGFETSAVQEDYDGALAAALGGDGLAPPINLAGAGGLRLLDERNTPDTGFGS